MALLWWGSGCFGENCKSEQNPQNAHLSHLSHLSLIHINSTNGEMIINRGSHSKRNNTSMIFNDQKWRNSDIQGGKKKQWNIPNSIPLRTAYQRIPWPWLPRYHLPTEARLQHEGIAELREILMPRRVRF